jgi:flagellar assembly protein FliH
VSHGSRVLKADAIRDLGSRIVFDFEDVQERAEQRVVEARAEAERLLAAARDESNAIREAARAEGHRQGRSEGLADAAAEITRQAASRTEARVAEKVHTLLPAIREAARVLEVERDHWRRHWENRAVELAVAIAERITRHEIAVRPETARDTLDEVLRLVSGTERIDVRMNPIDVERLGPNADEIVAALAGCGEARVVGDQSVTVGGCLVTTAFGAIDARIETQLDRLASELLTPILEETR